MSSVNVQEYQKLKELVEVLAGMRGDKTKAAIRMSYLKNLQDLISSLKGSTTDIQQKLGVLNDQITDTIQQLSNLSGQVGFLQSDVDGLQDDVNGLQIDIGNVQSGLTDAQDELAQINQQIADIQTDLSGLGTLTDRFNKLQTDVTAVSIPTMTQGPIVAAPTAAQFNALVTDVAAIRQAVLDLKNAII